ncbi:hypothetical protein [Alcanivorax sp.]|uniref:hypothetical protein n=1 Tax=Alcanivorax sp. TaxID=1872427 RepID=UPI002B2679C4|nr:hypothetical protein [Alcanivorax sp.]
MSFFVTITFDLNQAPTSAYPKIQKELENIDFSKLISGKRRQDNPLPGNTFVAEFDNDEFEDDAKSSDVSDYAKSEIKRIFKEHEVSGRYFVAAGKGWSWKVGTTK